MSPPTFARCSAVTGLLLVALSAPVTPSTAAHLPVRRACAVPAHPGEMACLALVRTDVRAPRAPHGVRPQTALIRRAGLEDVFLTLTGRSLVD